MMATRTYRALKITGIILLILLLAAGGAYLYLAAHYKRILQRKLPVVAARATDSLYRITAGDFNINVLTKTVSVINLRMRPDTAVVSRLHREGRGPHVLLDVTVPELELSGLQWGDMVTDREVSCAEVGIYHPQIAITITGDPPLPDSLKRRKAPAIERVFAQYIRISDPRITFRQGTGREALTVRSRGGEIRAEHWDFHPGEPSDSSLFFYAKKADVQLNRIVCTRSGSLYTFGIDTLLFTSADHVLAAQGAFVKPTVGKEEFYRETRRQQEIYEGYFPQVRLYDFAWEQFITRQSVSARRVDIGSADLDIYLSRTAPANTRSKVGNYPHQLLQRLKVPLNLPLICLQEGAFRYTELNEKTHRAGTLDFSSIHGQITQVTNLPEAIRAQPHCAIRLFGKFMRRSDMAATFDLPLQTRNGSFTVKGYLRDLDGSQISEAAKALALAEIKSLKLHRMDFSISGNDSSARGSFSIRYNDLKVKLQKVDTGTRRMHGRGFLSLIANELLLYNDNPMDGEPLRTAVTQVRRDPAKSFFNLIWRNMFDAGVQTALRNEGVMDLIKKKQANKGREKVHFFRKLFPKRRKKEDGTALSRPPAARIPQK